jgi:hypothetical protein
MSPRNDDRLPDDLRDVADTIRESRTERTPLDLEELKMRARRQAEHRMGGAATRWRKKLVATILALGLMLTSGTGVVVAAQSLGSTSTPKFSFEALKEKVKKPKKDASKSQYCSPTDDDDDDDDRDDDDDDDDDDDRDDDDDEDDDDEDECDDD